MAFGPTTTARLLSRPGLALRALATFPARLGATALWRDEAGATAMIVGLSATMLVGFAGLGTEMGLWYFTHRSLQNAADSAAMSAEAALFYADGNYIKEAKASAARYGFADGTNGVSVTVNKPPVVSPKWAGDADSIEVIISEPQVRLFTAMFSQSALTQTARAVARVGSNGNGCVVTLDKNAVVDLFDNGNTQLTTSGCDLYINADACDALDQAGGNTAVNVNGNIYVVAAPGCNGVSGKNVTGNIIPHVLPINDPYANVAQPGSHQSSCDPSTASPATYTSGNVTLNPGEFCGGISIGGNVTDVTLNPGVYVIDGGSFSAGGSGGNGGGGGISQGPTANGSNGGGGGGGGSTSPSNFTIHGDGVTIFLTGSGGNYANMQITGNASLDITPPTTGDSAGIGVFQDRNAPGPSCDISTSGCTAQNKINGNGAAVTGVSYFPNQSVQWGGNGSTNAAPGCQQIVAYQLQIVGNAAFSSNCTGVPGVAHIGALAGRLVE